MLDQIKNQSDRATTLVASGQVVTKVGQAHSLYQHSISMPVTCKGVGLHSGKATSMRLLPAPVGHGIVFVRTDINGTAENRRIPATWNNVNFATLCSQIANPAGHSVSTIEHLMAALAAMNIDNILIEIDGPEVPIMDGSSAPFVFLLECAGIAEQAAPRQYIEVLKPITVSESNGHGPKHAILSPAPQFSMDCIIEFTDKTIGRQEYQFTLTQGGFKNEISRARTFGFYHEVEQMRAAGFGLGGSLENSVVVGPEGVMNEGGLRFKNEFVRHKVLDLIGDLYLAGNPLLAHVEVYRSGHAMNNQLLRALFADTSAWRLSTPALTQNAANDPMAEPAKLRA
ncbi:MAG: UDP-3-O-acyl-N-acetylglucosamine deacetylase [Alphaproteobacteria bacterium]|nr:MAG: UDP-3-O-acyl-N-acetylglucosamine deacetylase [Alphaproteobacteria bacterium]